MNLKIIKMEDNKVRFNISGINVDLVNALRRIVISEIPTMAMEEISFYGNSSILDDEFLALRLGLIPLKTDLKTYNPVSECSCKGKGCAKCTAILTLDVKGPGTVYSRELKSTDPQIVPVHESIPIVKLTEHQQIKLEAKAELGIGKTHMKWQSGIASYEIKENGSFDFFVESFGQFEISDLMNTAFEVFNKKIKDAKTV
jgi:DNA-directed RNA polymerase subunit D